jgi:hypothetical protein
MITRALHIAFAAAWFGVPIAGPGLLRWGLQNGDAALEGAAAKVARLNWVAVGMGSGVLVTGLLMIFQAGGFAVISPRIHAAILVVVIMLALNVALLRPLLAKLQAKPAPAQRESLVKRFAMMAGITQGLWTVVLVLMLWQD